MKTRGLVVAMSVAALWAVCSCASATKGPDAPDSAETNPTKEPVSAQAETPNVSGYETEVDECVDKACVANNDCCSGYSCGFDPERSRVQRYCMPG